MDRKGFQYDRAPMGPEPQKSMTLTKAKLAQQVQQRVYGVKPWEARRLVETVIEIIRDTLAHGEDVLISGFGKFQVRRKGNRRGRNPQTGDRLTLRQRQVVVFRPSGNLRRKLNLTPVDREELFAMLGCGQAPEPVGIGCRRRNPYG